MMKTHTNKTLQTQGPHGGLSSRHRGNEEEHDTPIRIDLKVKLLPTNHQMNPSQPKTNKNSSRGKHDLQSTDFQPSDRTAVVNQFLLTTKQSLLPPSKNTSIKSYLRIKPNKNVSFMPFGIYNNQTIICDRSVYKFDYIFEAETPQIKVYQIVGKEVTDKFIEGYNGTIFAYGSTGSGKTFTMFGHDDGLVPSVVAEIFSKIGDSDRLSCSMIEIYKQNLIDLLTNDSDLELKIKEINSICTIHNLSVHEVKNQQQTLQLIKRGNHLKKIRETNLNQSSSRSHIVFTFHLQKCDTDGRVIRAKFNLVDLAGSEKVFKSKVQGEGLEEAKKINLSLSCLGNTISALVKNSDHIPYRESKLTRILKQSLMGNSITRLIVTCSINEQAIEETISSIKFAQRAQKVQTQAEIAYKINKFKGDNQQKQKLIRSALEKAESKINKIGELLIEDENNCKICKQIKQVLLKRENLTPEEIFNFNPINSLVSPKSRIDLRNYFSNTSERFSSVPRRQASKKNSFKCLLTGDRESEFKQLTNKKMFELKMENDRLKSEKMSLETRIKLLEQKIGLADKQNKGDKHKRIIKLGNGTDKSKNQKENISNLINTQGINYGKKENKKIDQGFKNDKQLIQIDFREINKANEIERSLVILKQFINKFTEATQQYRKCILPLQLSVLRQEVFILQSKNNKNTQLQTSSQDMNPLKVSNIFKLQQTLKKHIFSYYSQISMAFERLFSMSQYEFKTDISDIFKQKERDISHIKSRLDQCLDESNDLFELSSLLQKSKLLCYAQKQKKQKTEKKFNHLQHSLTSQNQFLQLKSCSPNTEQFKTIGKIK